jgi:hypothetical protein
MKRSKVNEEQVTYVLCQAEAGTAVEDICHRVILPFLMEIGSRHYAAMANRCFGVIPPKAMFERS